MQFNCPFFIKIFVLLVISPVVWSRPVSYPGGWTMMLMNNSDRNSVHIHYSPTARYSVGYRGEYWRDREFFIHALQVNNLVKRWNGPASQANIYLQSGLGLAVDDNEQYDDQTETVFFTGLAADWENRRFFVSYQNRYTEANDLGDFFFQSARFGVAPYIGDYGDLHTWLMLDVRHSPESPDNVVITPLVRLLKGVNMIEAGVSDNSDITFNWVRRF